MASTPQHAFELLNGHCANKLRGEGGLTGRVRMAAQKRNEPCILVFYSLPCNHEEMKCAEHGAIYLKKKKKERDKATGTRGCKQSLKKEKIVVS